MRQTITEKILSEHAGKRVKAGEVGIFNLDLCFAHDGTGLEVITAFKKLGTTSVFSKDKCCLFIDHAAPSPNIGMAAVHHKMRTFAKEFGIRLFDIGCGISHQVIIDGGFLSSGQLAAGADAHTCMMGALNTLGVGLSSADIAMAMASGKCWLKVPETIKVIVNGKLPKGVYAKDVIMHIVGDIGARGANYRAMEFYGDMISGFDMNERFTVCNMAVETGAKTAIMPSDKVTTSWLKKCGIRDARTITADDDAKYTEIRQYDMSGLVPQVARPHSPANVSDISAVKGTPVNAVYIGTCTNSSYEDLETAARILKGQRIPKGLKLIVTPSSAPVFLRAVKDGLVGIFVEAGGIVNNPGCGACSGKHQGVLADGEVVFSTGGRNTLGRMGNSNGSIYLGSPATAAATAIAGVISDPREHKRKL
jgi:3-isopropylmalate/(R)-2-methylmalate dehydratase large subunit